MSKKYVFLAEKNEEGTKISTVNKDEESEKKSW